MIDIVVWRPRIAIPKQIKEAAINFNNNFWNVAKYGNFRDDYGVDTCRVGGMDTLYTDGIVDWHTDEHMLEKYSLLFVIRNDQGSYVESQGVPPVKDQPVGTMVLLNIWHEHRLWHSKGKLVPAGVYLALNLDLDEAPPKKECERLMRLAFKQKGNNELFDNTSIQGAGTSS